MRDNKTVLFVNEKKDEHYSWKTQPLPPATLRIGTFLLAKKKILFETESDVDINRTLYPLLPIDTIEFLEK